MQVSIDGGKYPSGFVRFHFDSASARLASTQLGREKGPDLVEKVHRLMNFWHHLLELNFLGTFTSEVL